MAKSIPRIDSLEKQIKARKGGFYWVGKKPYISVTNVLKIIDKPQIVYWFGKEVYQAMVANPELDERGALNAPYAKSDQAKNRGTTVHSIVEAYKNGSGEIRTIPEYQGYATGFYNFVKDMGFQVTNNEGSIFSEVHKYAGTFDLRGFMQSRPDEYWLIDVKTGKDIYPEAGLQLSAYKHGVLEQGSIVHRIGVLLLSPTGKYKFAEQEDDFDIFLSAKKLYEWKNRETLEKYGYFD